MLRINAFSKLLKSNKALTAALIEGTYISMFCLFWSSVKLKRVLVDKSMILYLWLSLYTVRLSLWFDRKRKLWRVKRKFIVQCPRPTCAGIWSDMCVEVNWNIFGGNDVDWFLIDIWRWIMPLPADCGDAREGGGFCWWSEDTGRSRHHCAAGRGYLGYSCVYSHLMGVYSYDHCLPPLFSC